MDNVRSHNQCKFVSSAFSDIQNTAHELLKTDKSDILKRKKLRAEWKKKLNNKKFNYFEGHGIDLNLSWFLWFRKQNINKPVTYHTGTNLPYSEIYNYIQDAKPLLDEKTFIHTTDTNSPTSKISQIHVGSIDLEEYENEHDMHLPEIVLGNIEAIHASSLSNFAKLIYVGSSLNLARYKSEINLPQLEFVGNYLDISETSKIKDLNSLKYVGNTLFLDHIKEIQNISALESIDHLIRAFKCEEICDLPSLKYIKFHFKFHKLRKMPHIPNLRFIGGNVELPSIPDQEALNFNWSNIIIRGWVNLNACSVDTIKDLTKQHPSIKFRNESM